MMTISKNTDAWRELFSSLKIDVESSSPPPRAAAENPEPHDERPWFQTLTRFTRRGFLRVLVTPGEDQMGVHTQYAVPGADAVYAQALKIYLNKLSGVDWTSDTTESPWALYAEGISAAESKAVVEAFLRVADHIIAAEDGARASVLADEFGSPDKSAEPGSDASSKPAAPHTSSSPFESIGDGSTTSGQPSPAEEETASKDAQDNPGLKSFRVAVRDGVIQATLDLQAKPTPAAQSSLLDAFAQALPVRFDIVLLSADFADSTSRKSTAAASIELMMRANIKADTGEITGDLGRYFERVKKFNDFGLPLLEVLGGSAPKRDKSRSIPPSNVASNVASKKAAFAQKAATSAKPASGDVASSQDVVFSFGGGALDVADITSDALRPGDYTDPRIRRDDATTPLVDVVLRHPGFSDKSMRQVLSILLDVTYYDATKLTERAPCLIAWGVSQERAAEFKSVIENAGGRVTLVEPDSLS